MNLLDRLREERRMRLKGGIYHFTQIKLCYNSNRIEGNRLTEEQTRYIDEEHKNYYYRGLREFKKTPGYLFDTCLSSQDRYKEYLAYFRLEEEMPGEK